MSGNDCPYVKSPLLFPLSPVDLEEEVDVVSYQLRRVVDVLVGAELGLDVFVAEQSHPGWQMLPMRPEYPPVEGNGRQNRHWRRSQRISGCRRG